MQTVFRRSLRLPVPVRAPGASARATTLAASGWCWLLPLAGLSGQAAAGTTLEPVVVTATRSPQPLSQVLADVTVLQREDLERRGAAAVGDVLRGVAGLQMSRSGGPGATTAVYVRGGDQRFTAVLIDGVRTDTQTTGGASWESIPLSQIERIEILRGPASAWYGSDALGGVVQIFTRKGDGGVGLDVGLGLGSQHTTKSDVSISGASGPLDFALTAASESSRGFDGTVPRTVNPIADRDAYWSRSVSGRLGLQLNPAHRIEASALDSALNAQYDALRSRNDDRAWRDLQTVHAQWTAQWTPAWRSVLSAGQSDDVYRTRPSLYDSFTRVKSSAWQNDLAWDAHTLQVLLERREDELQNNLGRPAEIAGRRAQNALGLGYGWRRAGTALQLQARRDADSEFGGHSTGSIAAGTDIGAGWRARSSLSTGFRAPTLYQRYSEYGPGPQAAKLTPESSRNVEVGVQRVRGGSEIGLTGYYNRLTDLISFGAAGSCASEFGCYANVTRARIYGLTVEGRTLLAGVRLSGSVDLLSARNADTDQWLARRSRRTLSLQADKDLGDWTLGGQWLAASRRFDDPANARTLGGYGVLALDAQLRLSTEWRLQARLDNVLDKDYTTANNFVNAPRSAFVGVRWSPKF